MNNIKNKILQFYSLSFLIYFTYLNNARGIFYILCSGVGDYFSKKCMK